MLRYARVLGAKIKYCSVKPEINRLPKKSEIKKIHREVTRLAEQNFKIDISILNPTRRNKYEIANFHTYRQILAPRFYCKVECNDDCLQKNLYDKVVLTSPELTFLQLAKALPFYHVLQLGMEFCSTYAIDINSPKGFKYGILPATSVKKLIQTCKYLYRMRYGDAKLAIYTCKWLQNCAASPAESNFFIMLCGPRKEGMFQARKLLLNSPVKLSPSAAKICGCKQLRPDFVFRKSKLAIEYDSRMFHEEIAQNQMDKLRALALQHDGWKVINIVPCELNSYLTFSTIAKDVLCALGQDSRIKSKGFSQKSLQTFNNIFYRK